MKKGWQSLLIGMLLFTFGAEIYRKGRTINKSIQKYKMHKGIVSYKNQGELLTPFRHTKKKEFVVVIASYNNERFCEKNLLSVFDQNYDDYRVIYINDCSTDKTLQKVKDFVAYKKMGDRVTIIENKKRAGKMQNLFNAYHSCHNDEIIVCLDGDDSLAHNRVFEDLNAKYQNHEVWMTYGSAAVMPQGTILRAEPFNDDIKIKRSMRDHPFGMHMLRTFYAGLFKELKLSDFIFEGVFMPSADDTQIMISMIEMAPNHCLVLNKIHYIINDDNPFRTVRMFGQEEYRIYEWVKQLKKKPKLAKGFDPRSKNLDSKKPVDLLLFSKKDPNKLEQKLKAIRSSQKNLGATSVLYQSRHDEDRHVYECLKSEFRDISWHDSHEADVSKIIDSFTGKYLFLAFDSDQLDPDLDLFSSVQTLEKSRARAVLHHLSKKRSEISVAIHEDFEVLHTLSDSFCQNYDGYVLARRADVMQSLNVNTNKGLSVLHNQFLALFERDLFLHTKSKAS